MDHVTLFFSLCHEQPCTLLTPRPAPPALTSPHPAITAPGRNTIQTNKESSADQQQQKCP